MKRYNVEQYVGQLIDEFINENDLEYDFYGDCLPEEIMKIENRMEFMNEDDWSIYDSEIYSILESYMGGDE